jgi:hypothetical protein
MREALQTMNNVCGCVTFHLFFFFFFFFFFFNIDRVLFLFFQGGKTFLVRGEERD